MTLVRLCFWYVIRNKLWSRFPGASLFAELVLRFFDMSSQLILHLLAFTKKLWTCCFGKAASITLFFLFLFCRRSAECWYYRVLVLCVDSLNSYISSKRRSEKHYSVNSLGEITANHASYKRYLLLHLHRFPSSILLYTLISSFIVSRAA